MFANLPKARLILVCLTSVLLALLTQSANAASDQCGYWYADIQPRDPRLLLDLVYLATEKPCDGAYHLENGTTVLPIIGGGYTLELFYETQNADAHFFPAIILEGHLVLLPPLPLELDVIPHDPFQDARVRLQGQMTMISLRTDIGLFLLDVALTAAPSCGLSKKEILKKLFADKEFVIEFVKLTATFQRNAELIWRHPGFDTWGALEELQSLAPGFIEEVIKLGGDIVSDCVLSGLAEVVGKKIIFLALIGKSFAGWLPSWWAQYLRFGPETPWIPITYKPPVVEPAPEGLIAFTAGTDCYGGGEVAVVNADGTGLRRLTSGKEPVWSPDGRHIAFTTNRDGNWEIYVVGADGSSSQNLTHSPAPDHTPAWSPDGRKIAFVSNPPDRGDSIKAERIYVMNADGSGTARLVGGAVKVIGSVRWSPDGQFIAFSAGDKAVSSLHVMKADGTNLHRAAIYAGWLDWSPDSQFIVTTYGREIYRVNADTEETVTILSDPSSIIWGGISWSPDGRFIAFGNRPDGKNEIEIMNADGSNRHKLDDVEGCDPAWSPRQSQ